DGAVRASYEALNALVKQVQQFTFGFLDHRVLLNNILTPDRSLKNLESDFSKRGLGAVTFPAGITLGGYRRVLSVICASPEELDRNGGVKRYFEQNFVEGVRIIPGQKGTASTEETVLEGDPEALVAAQELALDSELAVQVAAPELVVRARVLALRAAAHSVAVGLVAAWEQVVPAQVRAAAEVDRPLVRAEAAVREEAARAEAEGAA